MIKTFAWLLVCTALACTATASAGTGYVAHPDPAGTQTLAIAGSVEWYALRDGRVLVLAQDGTCRRITWTPGRSSVSAPSSCPKLSAPAVTARSGDTSVELLPGSADRPDRLLVNGPSGRKSWPLPERAFHVDVDGRTAIFSTRSSREVYAVDLESGRSALVGLTRFRDTPRLDRHGIVFRDNVYKRLEHDGSTLLKFVPRRYIDAALRRVGRPLTVRGELADLAMDGSRVALAVRNWRGECDAVVYWNITWNYAIPITEEEERTCAWSRRGGTIQSVSLAGLRAAWVMRVSGEERLVAASSVDCFERLVVTARTVRGERIVSHSGDTGRLAYLVAGSSGSTLGNLDPRMRGQTLATDSDAPLQTVVDGGLVAVLLPDGTVRVRTGRGAPPRTIEVGAARTIALHAQQLVTLTEDGTLDVHDVASGRLLGSWPAPTGARPRLDVHFGVAVLTSGRNVYVVSLANGRTAVAARSQAPAIAAIEAPGIAYASPEGRRGTVRFVPFARIERLLGG